jgi:DNA-binding MarR family transcriptional regulator
LAHDSDERDALIDRVSRKHNEVQQRTTASAKEPLLASSLTMQQLKLVIILSHHEPASGRELAEALGVGLGTVTGIVDRLVAKGLVSRHEDPEDRRVRRVAFTDAGRTLVQKLQNERRAGFRRLIELLDTPTLHEYEKILEKMGEAAQRLRES